DTVSLDQLKQELDRAKVAVVTGLYDWQLFRGNASRSAKSRGGAPFLENKWQRTILPEGSRSFAKDWLDDALKLSRAEAMPAFFPIAAGGKVIYRSYWA